ncbi:MAG: hypothetical protein U0V56_02590 [Actinomycetota bacterium]
MHARRGVHEVARHHALPLGTEGDGGLAGEHTHAGLKVRRPHLLAERRDGGGEVERRADGALGVVLVGYRGSPYGHHRIADELLDDSP